MRPVSVLVLTDGGWQAQPDESLGCLLVGSVYRDVFEDGRLGYPLRFLGFSAPDENGVKWSLVAAAHDIAKGAA